MPDPKLDAEQAPLAEGMLDLHRRSLLAGIGAMAGASLFGTRATAQQVASGLDKRSQSAEAMAGKPMVFDKALRGNFDLATPLGNYLATMKMTNNLVGARTYIPMMGRIYLAPRGKPGREIHGLLGMWTWQLMRPDPKQFPNLPAHTVLQRASYTGIMTNPNTFEPAKSVYNHVLDKQVEPQDSLFAESYLFYANGTGSSIDRPQFMTTGYGDTAGLRNPFVNWGEQLSLYLAGLFQNEGQNQPRMDSSIWSAPRSKIMDPGSNLVPCDYNFTGLMRAWERPWSGHQKGDDTQLLANVKGTKLHSVEDIPDIVKRHLVEKYPERL